MKKSILLSIIISVFSLNQTQAQIKQQEASMWCWASCIQSALGQANVYQNQSQVVSRLFGSPKNNPATSNDIINVLHSYNFKAWSVKYPASPQDLYNTLTSGWKLIAFVNPSNNPQIGHFIMLQGISTNGLVEVSDPATGMSYQQNIQQLYYAWKWSESIVVGTPY